MQFVRLCTVDNSYEANFIKEDLAEENIPCMITNENITQLIPHMNGIMGSGVQVLVAASNLDRAKEILTNRHRSPFNVCPNCGSTNVGYGLGTKHRQRRLWSVVMGVLFTIPFGNVKQTYYCLDCKSEFRK